MDETSGILKSFIIGIENLVDHKVKVIRCDNGTEFKNKEMNQFCEMKGIMRQFSIARTPQQNRVAERRNRTLIEAARTMLADFKLPTTFWAEAVNTACYVQNRVLVVKPHNKTPYERFHGRTPTLSFMRPFKCPVTIFNTIDHLGKFDGKDDEGFFVRYSLNSKAFRVFNSRTRIVEENLHIRFSESTPNVVGSGLDWVFDIDALTRTMNYEPTVAGTQSNGLAGTKASDNADLKSSHDDGSKPSRDDGKKVDEDLRKESECKDQEKEDNVNSTNNVNTVSSRVLALETTKTTQANEIAGLKRRVKKLERRNKSRTHRLKRLYKVGSSKRVESSDGEGLGKEDASKQGRIADIDANKDIYLVNVHTDEDMFGVNDLDGDEVIVDNVDVVKTAEETRSVVEEVTVVIEKAKLVSAAEETVNAAATTVSTASTIPVSAATTTTTTTTTVSDVEITLAQALAELKSAKPKADKVVIQEPEQGTTTTTLTTIISIPKPQRTKGKGLDEELAFKLQAEEEEESWLKDCKLKSKKNWTNEEKARLTELVEENSKKAEAEITQERSSKIAGEELEQESSKKQKVEEDKETAELQILIEIVLDKVEVFSQMLKSFVRQDLKDLYKLVKAKYGSTRPAEDSDLILYGDLKTMFDPYVEYRVWRNQQDYKVLDWKIYDSCRVHSLREFTWVHSSIVVEKDILTPATITGYVNKKLQSDHFSEMGRIVRIKRLIDDLRVTAAQSEKIMMDNDIDIIPSSEGFDFRDETGFGSEIKDGVFWRGAVGVRELLLEETIWDPSTFEQEMAEAGFGAYWDGSDRLIPNKGDLRDYWIEISSGRDFLGPTPSYVLIRDPVRDDYKTLAMMIGERHKMSRFWILMITPCLKKKKIQGALLYLVLFIISVLIKLLLTLEQVYKYVITDLLPSLPINLMSKRFYYSIFGDKDEGKSHAGTLIDIPIFVGSFSIILGFTIIDDDDMTKDIVLGINFCKKYASCQRIMKRFALGNNCERIMEDEYNE
ncbi:putative ribonuclease H-like domain-containing protein [Tanacetum coccineum]